MEEIRSFDDLGRAHLPPDAAGAARESLATLLASFAEAGMRYDPAVDGHIAVLEAADTDDTVRASLGYPLRDAVFEGVSRERGCFAAVVLHNNEFGITIVVPDAPWLDPALRERLSGELGEGG
jgi:hypothetical protein